MDDTPINLENVLDQAPNWTFAGDFTLLQWMNKISQDLEARATKTSETLDKLNNNVKSTNIALDNVANSLTALQFGNQFVECRVQDDDETVLSTNESSSDIRNHTEHLPTSKEMLNKFLDNNLKVLRNCHEKYTIDLDDSDEDDEGNPKEKTCIYQPINHYNEKPLPFIYGSKDWHAKWHVGLYENERENSYSGDEVSEAFSESSSASNVDDNESFESNTEWTSSNSIDNDILNTNIEVNNATFLRGSQPIYPGTPSLQINVVKNKTPTSNDSSSVSTSNSSVPKKSISKAKQSAMLPKRSESINSIISKNSSKPTTANNKNTLLNKTQSQPFVDLFAEPPEDLQSTTSSSVSSTQNAIQSVDNSHTLITRKPLTSRIQPPPFVDLFAEPPEDIPTSSNTSSGKNVKRKTVNLFDDDEDENDMDKDDILSVLAKKELAKPKTETEKKLPCEEINAHDNPLIVSKTTSKSLFDDSDDDEDFLKAFRTKSSNGTSKTLLFDNEIDKPPIDNQFEDSPDFTSEEIDSTCKKTQNIFNTTEENADLLFNKTSKIKSKNTKIAEDKKSESISVVGNESTLDDQNVKQGNVKKSVNLFDDLEDIPKLTYLIPQLQNVKKINLFDDLEDDDDDLFSKETNKPIIQPKSNMHYSTDTNLNKNQTKSKDIAKYSPANNINYKENCGTSVTNIQDKLMKSVEIASDSNDFEQKNDRETSTPKIDKIQEIGVEVSIGENNDTAIKIDNKLTTDETFLSNPSEQIDNDNIQAVQDEPPTDLVLDTQKQISSNKYDFNSILFTDEPPEDDNEFFETLSKTPQNSNTKYNTIDLEHDIYEPELPKIPVSQSGHNNQVDNTENRTSNLYTGLQLFSDIPPDDDGADEGAISNPPSDVNQIKRLHGVFYDDFNETLMALNQNQIEHNIPTHTLFSDEPPPINEEFSKDITDYIGNDVKQVHHKSKASEIANEMEETFTKENVFTPVPPNKRPISKLQMPHININVQALLPGANSTLPKAKEVSAKSKILDQDYDIKPSSLPETKQETCISKPQTAQIPRTSETEHILPSVTKNRVRAPASRRPSTRRARQENYRKSLIEEEQNVESDNTKERTQSENQFKIIDIPKNSSQHIEIKYDKVIPEQQQEKPNPSILKEVPKECSESSSNSTPPISLLTKDANDTNRLQNRDKIKLFSVDSNYKLFFDDDGEEDDDDLFQHIKTSKVNDNKATEKSKENKAKSTEQSNGSSSQFSTNKEANKEMHVHTLAETAKTTDSDEQLDLPKDNLSIKTHITQSIVIQIENQAKTSHQSSMQKSTAKSSFLDDFDEEDDDKEDIFKAITKQKPTNSKSLKSNYAKQNPQIKLKSLLDSESDSENDSTVAGLQTTGTTNTATTNSTSVPQPKSSKPTNSKLFSDSDTDSDDLFGKLSSTKSINIKVTKESSVKKAQTKVHSKSNIFSDASDEDDFLSTSASVSKNAMKKTALKEEKPIVSTQTSASLFSDIESDEDDLFGSSAAKVPTGSATNDPKDKTPPSTSKPIASATSVVKSKTIEDNPLADLL